MSVKSPHRHYPVTTQWLHEEFCCVYIYLKNLWPTARNLYTLQPAACSQHFSHSLKNRMSDMAEMWELSLVCLSLCNRPTLIPNRTTSFCLSLLSIVESIDYLNIRGMIRHVDYSWLGRITFPTIEGDIYYPKLRPNLKIHPTKISKVRTFSLKQVLSSTCMPTFISWHMVAFELFRSHMPVSILLYSVLMV